MGYVLILISGGVGASPYALLVACLLHGRLGLRSRIMEYERKPVLYAHRHTILYAGFPFGGVFEDCHDLLVDVRVYSLDEGNILQFALLADYERHYEGVIHIPVGR